jgi:hypothetical protein
MVVILYLVLLLQSLLLAAAVVQYTLRFLGPEVMAVQAAAVQVMMAPAVQIQVV